MTFIEWSDLQPYCPNESQENISAVVSDVEELFCGLLPLNVQDRDISFYDDEIFIINGWNKVNTALLNINSAKVGDVLLDTIKVVGPYKSELFFKCSNIGFEPVFTISINSGYTKANLPGDLKNAMIEYAKDQVLMLGNPSGTTSITMGPRKLTFSGNDPKDSIMKTIYKYLI